MATSTGSESPWPQTGSRKQPDVRNPPPATSGQVRKELSQDVVRDELEVVEELLGRQGDGQECGKASEQGRKALEKWTGYSYCNKDEEVDEGQGNDPLANKWKADDSKKAHRDSGNANIPTTPPLDKLKSLVVNRKDISVIEYSFCLSAERLSFGRKPPSLAYH